MTATATELRLDDVRDVILKRKRRTGRTVSSGR